MPLHAVSDAMIQQSRALCSPQVAAVDAVEDFDEEFAALFSYRRDPIWHDDWPMSEESLRSTAWMVMTIFQSDVVTAYAGSVQHVHDIADPNEHHFKTLIQLRDTLSVVQALTYCLKPTPRQIVALPDDLKVRVEEAMSLSSCTRYMEAGEQLLISIDPSGPRDGYAEVLEAIFEDTLARCEKFGTGEK